jgi:DnaJ-class molecular chaperone
MRARCKWCYGAGITFWPIGGDQMQARPCEHCNGEGSR